MPPLPKRDRPHIVFLFSDTGGGHRSGAEAIIEALQIEYPGQVTSEMVDIFRQYGPPPLNKAPDIYSTLSRMPDLWRMSYQMSDGRYRASMFNQAIWPYIRRPLRRLLSDHPCDLIVSMHQLTNAPVLHAMKRRKTPFATVVLDMVSTHAFWFDRRANLVMVPTEAACQRALKLGLSPDQVHVVGMPVAQRFCQPPGNRAGLRARLGWRQDLPITLLVGGGDGMGPLERTARAIDSARLPTALVIVTGRNRKLKAALEKRTWHIPVAIYGFVHEMPDFMRAADILVTKAGPGTISEAFIAGLPIILYSKMPGQEDGNVTYVVKQGAGLWRPSPAGVTAALRDWLQNPEKRQRAADACLRLAHPEASRHAARLLAGMVGLPTDLDLPPGCR